MYFYINIISGQHFRNEFNKMINRCMKSNNMQQKNGSSRMHSQNQRSYNSKQPSTQTESMAISSAN